MRTQFIGRWLIALCLTLMLMTLFSGRGSEGRRLIAIFDFDYATVADEWRETPINIGAGLADMLVTELVAEGTYTVVERKRLQQVIDEQDLNRSDRFDPGVATEIGRLLGVDAVVIGSVTQFGLEKSTTENLDAAGDYYGGVQGLKTHIQKAVVGVDVRMIDTKSGVILAAATGNGVDRRSAITSDSRGGSYLEPGVHMSFSDISQQLVGGAAAMAVLDVAIKLIQQANRLQLRAIRGMIAYVESDTVVVNIGRADGLTRGDMLAVERIHKVVKDPADTTKVLRKLSKRVATLEVQDVDENSALALVVWIAEEKAIQVGFEVVVIDASSEN